MQGKAREFFLLIEVNEKDSGSNSGQILVPILG
jgi:hypothetical protein